MDETERLAGVVADARRTASEARHALFSLPVPAEDASVEVQRAWRDKATTLRQAAATAEQALSVSEEEGRAEFEREAMRAPGGGRSAGGAMFAAALAGAPPEVREYRELMRKASLGRVVSSAMRGERLSSGVEVEIRQAGGLADDCIPYELLDPGVQAAAGAELQHRVDVVSGGLSSVPTYQHTIIQRVFAPASCVSVLGCRMLMAPTGDALVPEWQRWATGGPVAARRRSSVRVVRYSVAICAFGAESREREHAAG